MSTQLEAGVALKVLDELGLLLAYRWWNYESEDLGSDLKADIDLSGPVFGLVLEF